MSKVEKLTDRVLRITGLSELPKEDALYLEKYYLPNDKYQLEWNPIYEKIFFTNIHFPNDVFRTNFDVTMNDGGILLEKESFEEIKRLMRDYNETKFVILELNNKDAPFCMCYPYETTWDMITSGDIVTYELYERPIRNYIMFGNSGHWGKVIANDFEKPVEYLGLVT